MDDAKYSFFTVCLKEKAEELTAIAGVATPETEWVDNF